MALTIKQEFNNDIVLMRHLVRKVKVHIIHKLSRNVKSLRQKKKGNENEKYEKKIERWVEEILALKTFKDDNISKQIILETRTSTNILSDINSSNTDRVLAKVMAFSTISEKVKEIRNKYPENVINEFYKGAKHRARINKQKKKSKCKKKVANDSKNTEIQDSNPDNMEDILIQNGNKESKQLLTEVEDETVFDLEHDRKSKKRKISTPKIQNEDVLISNRNKSDKKLSKAIENDDEMVLDLGDRKSKRKIKISTPQIQKEDVLISNRNKTDKKLSNEIENDDEMVLDLDDRKSNRKIKLSTPQIQNEDVLISNRNKTDKKLSKEIENDDGMDLDDRKSKRTIKLSTPQIQNEDVLISNRNKTDKKLSKEIENDDGMDLNYDKKSKKRKIEMKTDKKSKEIENNHTIDFESNRVSKSSLKKTTLHVEENVDSFFLMSNGQDEYLSVVNNIPVDNIEKQNCIYTDNLNRRQRRQLQKNGKVPKRKFVDKNATNKDSFINVGFNNNKLSFENETSNSKSNKIADQVENLHPSWQAKLLQNSKVVKFEGKKIVFD